MNQENLTTNNTKKEKIFAVLTGVFAGAINGLFGGGGGMVIVPLLIRLLKFEERYAHATAILLILPLSLVSGLIYASFGSTTFNVLIPAGLGVIGGGVLGALFLKKLSSKWITGIFSVAMLAAGVKMLFF